MYIETLGVDSGSAEKEKESKDKILVRGVGAIFIRIKSKLNIKTQIRDIARSLEAVR